MSETSPERGLIDRYREYYNYDESELTEEVLEAARTGIVPGETERVIEALREGSWAEMDPWGRAMALAYIDSDYDIDATASLMNCKSKKVSRSLRDPIVRAFLKDIQSEMLATSIVTRERVREMMLEVYEMATGKRSINKVLGNGAILENVKDTNLPVAKSTAEWFGKETGLVGGGPEENTSSPGVTMVVNLVRPDGSPAPSDGVIIEQTPTAASVTSAPPGGD